MAVKRKLHFLLLGTLLVLSAVYFTRGQQPQTSTAPIYAANAKYVNGVAPGYWPTAGSGLVLNISAGTANCSSTMVTYAGGTLTLTASSTNYVYLNTASSCAVTFNTTGFTSQGIPIATVVTSASAITSITDDRTMQSASGGGVSSWSGDSVLFDNSGSTGAVTAHRASNTAPARVYGTPSAGAASHIVQHTSGFLFSSTSVAVAYGSNVAANDLLVAIGWVNSCSISFPTGTSVTDTLGNTFTLGPHTPASECFGIWYSCASVSSGADTVTLAGGGNWYSLLILEISGNATSSCLDQSGTNSASSTAATVTASSSLTGNDIVVAGFAQCCTAATYTAGPAQTSLDTVNGSFSLTSNSEYMNLIQSSGTPSMSSTLSASSTWVAAIAAFKETAAGAAANFINLFQNGAATIEDCGTTAACAQTVLSTPFYVKGTASLVSGSPSTVTITGLPFSSSTSYVCTANDRTTAANGVKMVPSSGSQAVITGPNTVTDGVGYICGGNL